MNLISIAVEHRWVRVSSEFYQDLLHCLKPLATASLCGAEAGPL